MHFTPHAYQTRAISWVTDHPQALLFLDMGLGKSVITLTAISRLIDWGEITSALIIAPKRVAESTWSQEAGKWDHLAHLRVSVILGTADQCRRAAEAPADVYVTSRDRAEWLCDFHRRKLPYGLVAIDELTSFKNPRAKRFKALRKSIMPGTRTLGLTGTPTPNGLTDLWAQVYCIDRGQRLGPYITHYRRRWFDVVEHNNIVIKCFPKPGAEKEIRDRLSDIALTMRAEDWLDLPPLIEEDVPVLLPDAKLRAYRKFEQKCVLETEASGPITADSAAALVNKLSQFANGAVYDEKKKAAVIHDCKLEMLREILEASEEPVLCFYSFKHDCERIEYHLSDFSPRVYSGDSDLQEWNAGRIRLLLAHPASTAYGLNMQKGGSLIVWFSTGWNLELYQQANARLHRQGQTKPVRVLRLMAAGTVDERMARAIADKGKAQAGLVKGMAQGIITDNKKQKLQK